MVQYISCCLNGVEFATLAGSQCNVRSACYRGTALPPWLNINAFAH